MRGHYEGTLQEDVVAEDVAARGRRCKRMLREDVAGEDNVRDDNARRQCKTTMQDDNARKTMRETTMRGHCESKGDIIHCKGDYAKDDGMTASAILASNCCKRSSNSRSHCNVHPLSMICGS
jgi:hypothetical protein